MLERVERVASGRGVDALDQLVLEAKEVGRVPWVCAVAVLEEPGDELPALIHSERRDLDDSVAELLQDGLERVREPAAVCLLALPLAALEQHQDSGLGRAAGTSRSASLISSCHSSRSSATRTSAEHQCRSCKWRISGARRMRAAMSTTSAERTSCSDAVPQGRRPSGKATGSTCRRGRRGPGRNPGPLR